MAKLCKNLYRAIRIPKSIEGDLTSKNGLHRIEHYTVSLWRNKGRTTFSFKICHCEQNLDERTKSAWGFIFQPSTSANGRGDRWGSKDFAILSVLAISFSMVFYRLLILFLWRGNGPFDCGFSARQGRKRRSRTDLTRINAKNVLRWNLVFAINLLRCNRKLKLGGKLSRGTTWKHLSFGIYIRLWRWSLEAFDLQGPTLIRTHDGTMKPINRDDQKICCWYGAFNFVGFYK